MIQADPVVTVVIPTRNRSALLRRALQSVARQSLAGVEVLVVDDGSDAEHRAAYRELQQEHPNARFLLAADGETGRYGPSENRNRGIRAASGEFVAFLDDDDHWVSEDHLEIAIDGLRSRSADFLFASWRLEDDGRVRVADWHAAQGFDLPHASGAGRASPVSIPQRRFYDAWSRGFLAHLNTCVVRRSLLVQVGGFYAPVQFCEDWHLVARIADAGARILYRPDVVAVLDVTPRERAFSAYRAADKHLQVVMMAQHLSMTATDSMLRRAARKVESAAYVAATDALLADRRVRSAAEFAWRAVRARPGRHSLSALSRVIGGALRR